MSSHYEHLKLRSASGVWANSMLQSIGDKLLPVNVSQSDFQLLLDDMATAAEQNPYLHNVLMRLNNDGLDIANSDLKKQVDEIAPDLLTYAMVLENLTKAMVENPRLLASINVEFDTHTQEQAAMSFVHKVKYYSVRAAIQKSLEVHEKGSVPGAFSSFFVAIKYCRGIHIRFVLWEFWKFKSWLEFNKTWT